jgi:DNA topoisomerase VI subunit A
MDDAAWILIVEKEATFNSLVEAKFNSLQSGSPGLIVTVPFAPLVVQ